MWKETERELELVGRAVRQQYKSDTEWRREKRELSERLLGSHAVHQKFNKAISSWARSGQQRSPVSTRKGSVLASLPNSVTGGEQSTGSADSLQR